MRIRSVRSSSAVILGAVVLLGAFGAMIRSEWAMARGARVDGPLTGKQRAMVELGRRLFFEPVLSLTGQRACASCHNPDFGFSDPSPFSLDDVGSTLRHAQTIIDSAFNPSAHWDGEFANIEILVTARIGLQGSRSGVNYRNSPPPLTPGHSSLPRPEHVPGSGPRDQSTDEQGVTLSSTDLARHLAALPRGQDVVENHGRYAEAFHAVFGDAKVTRARVSRAIAAYCRSIFHTPAPYDHWKQGETRAMSAAAQRGAALFTGRAGCVQCHVESPYDPKSAHDAGRRAAFTDLGFHNTGIAWEENLAHAGAPEAKTAKPARRFALDDPGRMRVTTSPSERRAFKTPTLREVARRGPYMHNASLPSLDAVVRYYAGGGGSDPDQDVRIRPFEVTDQDVSDLVAFLGALNGDARPGLASERYGARATQTRLRFVDGDQQPIVGLSVKLVPAGDVLPKEAASSVSVRCTTDDKGWIRFSPRASTHVRLVLGGGLVPTGGALVPDSCAKAVVHLPVRGHVTVAVHVPEGRTVPVLLPAEHVGGLRFQGHEPPRTMLRRTHTLPGASGTILRYRGWMRTDVPATVVFRMPGFPASPILLRSGKPTRITLK